MTVLTAAEKHTQPIIWNNRCKICNLAKTHPDLYRELHSHILEANMSLARAMNHINARIDAENLQLVKINNQNMNAHFSSHIAIPDRVNHEVSVNLSGHAPNELKVVNPTLGYEVEDMIRRRVGNEVNDYLNLESLRTRLMEKLDILDEMVVINKDGENQVLDLDGMDNYVDVVKEIRGCIVDLNKIRQSKQIISMVLKALVEKQTFQVVRELSREYDQIKRDLIEAGTPPDAVISIDQKLRLRLAEIVANTARAALEDVSKSYKLQIG